MPAGIVQIWVLFPMDQETQFPNTFGFNSSLLWFVVDDAITTTFDLNNFAFAAGLWFTFASLPVVPYLPPNPGVGYLNCYSLDNLAISSQEPWGAFTGDPVEYLPSRSCVILRRFTSQQGFGKCGRMFWPTIRKTDVTGNFLTSPAGTGWDDTCQRLAMPFSFGFNNAWPALPDYQSHTLSLIDHYTPSQRLGQYRKKNFDKHKGLAPLLGAKAL